MRSLLTLRSCPLLTIVSVTFNDDQGIARTLESLQPLLVAAGGDIEVLIQNGGSGRQKHLSSKASQVSIVEEPDCGIYDGMNKALKRSRGRFVWFLNGGDSSEVASWSWLQGVLGGRWGAIIFFDYYLDFGRRSQRRRARPIWYMNHGLPTSHQAIIYPGDVARKQLYDVGYRVAADYAFTAAILAAGNPFTFVHEPLASFSVGGMSQQNAKLIAEEAAIVQEDILGASRAVRTLSSGVHWGSRIRRGLQTRGGRGTVL